MADLLHSALVQGFLKSWGMILVSEIGDKTFFIAAIMAMKNPRSTVFIGALSALALMTALSAAMGWAAPNLISKKYTHYAATALFLFFGVRTLYSVIFIKQEEGESELEEVERELQGKGIRTNSRQSLSDGKDDGKKIYGAKARGVWMLVSPIFLEAFTLTFLAEWGDRSQIATIGLAASIDAIGVTLGGVLGHAICTGAAVLGGRHLASHIDEKTVSVFGGLLFLAFGIHAALEEI